MVRKELIRIPECRTAKYYLGLFNVYVYGNCLKCGSYSTCGEQLVEVCDIEDKLEIKW